MLTTKHAVDPKVAEKQLFRLKIELSVLNKYLFTDLYGHCENTGSKLFDLLLEAEREAQSLTTKI
jgi:hypothetical protein